MTTTAVLCRETRLLLLFIAGLAAAGCGPDDRAASHPTAALSNVAEPSWTEQIDAVRTGTSQRVIVHDRHISPDELADLARGCDALEVLELDDVDLEAGGLDVVGLLPNLERIKLGVRIDDDGIERLARAQQLVAVNLPDAEFTDRGLELLAGLPHLELLRFHSPHVTDAGMEQIARMPALRFLHLIDVPVTDAGLAHLQGLGGLESLYLDGGKCTEAGLRALLTALPELHFHIDQLHLPGDPGADDHADSSPVGPAVD